MNSEMAKQGYKHTEVGVIPEEWSIHRLENVLERLKNGAVYTAAKNGGIPISRIETISSGKIDFEKVGFAEHSKQLEQYRLQPKDILFSHINSLDHIGKVAIYDGVEPLYHGMNLLLLRAAEGVIPNFLFHWLDSPIGRQRTAVLAKQAVSQASISTSDLRGLMIPLPTKQEQSHIADAIDGAEYLLNKLDQLIAKKRDIKQAAMQQLLTGQTRLPGFSGEWEIKSLGEVALLKNGYMFKSETYSESGKYKVVTIANVQDGFMRMDNCNSVDDLPSDLQPHQLLDVGDLLLSMTGNVGRVCQVTENDCLLNQRVGKIVARCIEFDFLYAVLSDRAFQKAMIDVAKGGAQPNLSAQDILGYPINAPKTQEEQRSIAIILSNIEADLKALEARRRKTQALKEGMMQELLTGKTRIL